MKNLIFRAVAIPAGALLLVGTILASPAHAAVSTVTTCGTTLSSPGSYTVGTDIGPCTGDGVDVVANGVTVKLNGHTITGNDAGNTSPTSEQIGINLLNVKGVTIAGPGTVTHFDAGVSIIGGGGNTVKNVSANANVAHVLLTAGGATSVDQLQQVVCNFGDGITTDNSTGNSITGNSASMNGPYSGISLVDASSRNNVARNRVTNNNVSNTVQSGPDGVIGHDGPCGPFGANAAGFGRTHQDIGIRIEGPGATHNIVQSNIATDNQLEGISIHGNVCASSPANGGPPATAPNSANSVEYNTVLRNGFADNTDGISILQQGPLGIVCPSFGNTITGNVSSGNAHDGIFVAGRGSHNNNVIGNTVLDNGSDGIELRGPSRDSQGNLAPGSVNNIVSGNVGHGNGSFDGFDFNLSPPCDHNIWTANRFGTVNQACVAGHGGTGVLPPPGPITTVTTSGTSANPTITVNGSGFGSSPPAPDPSTSPVGQQGCPSTYANGSPIPTSGGGFLYGTSLFFQDLTSGWAAGLNGNGTFDCIGIVIDSWSNTQVVFHFGDTFGRTDIPDNAYFLRNGDAFTVDVGMAQFTGVATTSG